METQPVRISSSDHRGSRVWTINAKLIFSNLTSIWHLTAKCFRYDALFNPTNKPSESVARKGARASLAMLYAWYLEEAEEVLRIRRDLENSVVVLDGPIRRYQLISETVPGNHLAAILLELPQIGLGGIHKGEVFLTRAIE